MSWLIVCPHHYLGIAGMLYFFLALYYQPNIKRSHSAANIVLPESNLIIIFTTTAFSLSIFYAASYLPYGKFYNRLGGNPATLASFLAILITLSVNFN